MQTKTTTQRALGSLIAGLATGAPIALGASALLVAASALAPAQSGSDGPRTLDATAERITQDIRDAEAELSQLRTRAEGEILPLSAELRRLEKEYSEATKELRATTRSQSDAAQQLVNLTKTIESRRNEAEFISGLFDEYGRSFESRLHISEFQRYLPAVEKARLAPQNTSLTQAEVFAAQAEIVNVALERTEDLLSGTKFEGTAVDGAGGLLREGEFVLVGPSAIFRSDDGSVVGTVQPQLGSLEPNVMPFGDELDRAAAAEVVKLGSGTMPFDPSLGNALKVEATEESLVEHVQKGGAIIYPILVMAALALLVALYKWVTLLFVRKPSSKKLKKLLATVREGDEDGVKRRAKELPGPAGRMLEAGADNMRRSRELMEEVMFEKVLVTKNKLQKGLPFIAVAAASAPLLGLLGTVTGIINTFKQITIFGSGDVKQLSGGISEALITTKFGLIVAIPSLLLHAYLSRKARAVTAQMETNAVQFANEVARSEEFGESSETQFAASGAAADQDAVRGQVHQVLLDMLGPLDDGVKKASKPGTAAGV